jgi:hypothetical protein
MLKRLLIPVVIATGLLGSAAHAKSTQDSIVAELREQGFTRIEIQRTLLGRTRILAESPAYEREIVLNPSSGVILRDFWTARDGGGGRGPANLIGRPNDGDGGNRGTSGNSGRGSSASGSDRSDDDDDNSGSGSSNSGSGSGDNDDDDDGGSSDSSGSGSGGSDDNDDDD